METFAVIGECRRRSLVYDSPCDLSVFREVIILLEAIYVFGLNHKHRISMWSSLKIGSRMLCSPFILVIFLQ